MTVDKKLSEKLIALTLSEFVALAGGSIADWSRWISGARDVRISSLFEPALKLGLTPGELLDVILERRRLLLQQKMQALEAQIHKGLPKNDFTRLADCKQFGWNT